MTIDQPPKAQDLGGADDFPSPFEGLAVSPEVAKENFTKKLEGVRRLCAPAANVFDNLLRSRLLRASQLGGMAREFNLQDFAGRPLPAEGGAPPIIIDETDFAFLRQVGMRLKVWENGKAVFQSELKPGVGEKVGVPIEEEGGKRWQAA